MQGDFQVPGYEVEGLLGASSSGEVWLARDEATGEKVALKRLQVHSTAAQEKARQIVETIGSLAHPHLMRIRDLLASEDGLVLILDHAAGGSLDQLLLARGTLDPGEVVTTVGPIAEALAAAHGRQLVHGDVNPENIHYTREGLPLLADLAVSTVVEGGLDSGGTHGYVDPAASSTEAPTAMADVYALAAVCFAALTGAPPDGEGHRPLHEVAPGVPAGLSHAVEAGLQPDPSRRPTTAQFAELVYAACQPAPVRFPVGLLPADDDGGASSGGNAQDPFLQTMRGSGTPQGSGEGSGTSSPQFPPPPPTSSASPSQSPGPEPSVMRRLDAPAEPASRRRLMPMILAGVLGVLVLAGLIVGGFFLANSSEPDPDLTKADPTSASPSTDPTGENTGGPGGQKPPLNALPVPDAPASPRSEADWRKVMVQLDTKRINAYRLGDVEMLEQVYAPNSTLLQDGEPCRSDSQACPSDVRKLKAYIDLGVYVDGQPNTIKSLRVDSQQRDRAQLTLVEVTHPSEGVYKNGVREKIKVAEGEQQRTFTMHRTNGTWLIAETSE